MSTNDSPLTPDPSLLKRLAAEHGLAIDPGFRAFCPTHSADELAQLERSLLAEGCRDDLVAWKATNEILDGHNRYSLCERHGLRFGVVFLDLPDREACNRWILANQLARRNISTLAASYFRGSRYLLDKGAHGGDHSNGEKTSHVATLEISTRLAEDYHVSRATIFRDATFAAAVDAIASTCGHEAKRVILARDSVITRRAVLLLAKLNAEARQRAIEEVIENGKLPRRTRDDKRATITLPAEPKALAEKLIERLGPEACVQVVARVKKLLPRETKEKGTSGSERHQPAAQARPASIAGEITAAKGDTEEGKRGSGEDGVGTDAETKSFYPEPSATAATSRPVTALLTPLASHETNVSEFSHG